MSKTSTVWHTGDGTDGAKGWIVLIDRNGNQKADAGEQIIFSHGPVPKGIAIKFAFTDSKVQYIAYNGTGRTRINANTARPRSWVLCRLNWIPRSGES